MVAVAPHKSGGGLGAPLPVEKMGKQQDDESSEGEPPEATDQHEAQESPAEESDEEYGRKLLTDIDAVGKQYGADSSTTRSFVGDLLSSIAKCLKGESHDSGGDEGSDDGMAY